MFYQTRQSILRAMRGLRALSGAYAEPMAGWYGLRELSLMTSATIDTAPHDEEAPIFLLATGWRTGSTLAQRILVTAQDLLLWGEPHDRIGLISRMGDVVAAFDRRITPDKVILRARSDGLSTEWIANLYPKPAVLRSALQAMIYEWLAAPAKALGYKRWGMKEVRLGSFDAALLHWLFPRATFLVVTRDPREAYRSAMQLGPLWERYPDRLIADPYSYGRLWNRLASSWLDIDPGVLPPHRLLRLEDIGTGAVDFADLESFLQIQIDPEIAVSKNVGAGKPSVSLGQLDRILIDAATRSTASKLGYAR